MEDAMLRWAIIACSLLGAPAFSQQIKLPGGQSGTYPVPLLPSQTRELQIVEQQGMAGIVSLLAADGTQLVEADISARHGFSDNLLIPPGAVSIRVDPPNHSPLERIFELRLGEPHAVSERDRLRIDAEKLLGEAERLGRNQKEGHLPPALAAYQKALEAWTQLADRPLQAYLWLGISGTQIGLGQLKPAAESARKALDLSGDDRFRVAEACAQMVVAGVFNGATKQVDEYTARALEMARASGDVRSLAHILAVVADIETRHGQTAKARADYAEALTYDRAAGDRLGEADASSYLATLEHDLGHFKEAVEAGEHALAIDTEENDLARTGSCLVRLSNVYASLGDFPKAISYGERAAPILKSSSTPSRYANSLYNLASYYSHVDDYQASLKTFYEALAIFQKIDYSIGRAYVYSGLASAYLRIGDEEKADANYQQSATEFHKASNKQGEIVSLLAAGGIAARHHQLPKAIDAEQKALAIAVAAGFEREKELALGDMAETYWQAKDARASLERATEKIELIRKSDHPAPEQEAGALRQQGRALRSLHEYDLAEPALTRALELSRTAGVRLQEANALYELAALERDRGRPEPARERILEGLALFEAIGSNVGNAESRMLFAAAHRKAFDLAIHIAADLHTPAEAFELSERARARALVDLIRGARLDIRAGVDPALLNLEQHIEAQLNTAQDRLSRLKSSTHAASAEAPLKKELDSLIDSYRQTEGEIRRKSPQYAELIEPRALSLAGVQAILPDADTAVLEFWMGEDHGYVWLVTKTACRSFELPARSTVEPLARRAYEALNARNLTVQETIEQKHQRVEIADHEFTRLAQQLSRTLLAPIRGLAGIRRLWIVSDGALEYLPFPALPAPGTGAPLLATHEIVRLPSASVVVEMRQQMAGRAPAPRPAAVFADPVFRSDDERVSGKRTGEMDVPRGADDVDLAHLPRLYYSRQEADAITGLARGVREELDFDASRPEVKKLALENFRVVHFATHAFLDSKHPELSGLVLSMVDPSGQPQDGFLSLHEIYNLKLNADLVVLSGCQTALGQEVRSEGLVGLTRGFMYAGATQVLASLWGVRDRATADLMRRFYAAFFERHLAPSAALRDAQLAMMKDPHWSAPYFWAAFTVQGAR